MKTSQFSRLTLSTLAATLSLGLPALAGTFHVDAAATICPGSGSAAEPFCEIQRALDLAQNGDTISVAPGTYYERLVFRGKAVLLTAPGGAGNTTLDASSLGTVISITNGEDSSTVLEGFTITGGLAPYGAGIRLSGTSPEIRDCVLTDNVASQKGGGISMRNNSNPHIHDCQFTSNSALTGDGGGLYLDGSAASVEACIFIGNQAGQLGGGISMENQSAPTLTGVFFHANRSDGGGGGLAVNGGSATLLTCVLLDNISALEGGAIFAQNNAQLALDHTLVAANDAEGGTGGGLFLNSSTAILSQVTFASNSSQVDGCGIFGANSAQVSLSNCIFWGNGGSELIVPFGAAAGTFTNIEGGLSGTGNMDLDPLFVDPANRDYRLSAGSPCIDAGDPNGTLDPDGSAPDMGAFGLGTGSTDCSWTSYCETSPNSVGAGGILQVSGSVSIAAGTMTLIATGVPANNWGIFFYGASQDMTTFGDGYRCVAFPVNRLGSAVNSEAAGTASLPLNFGQYSSGPFGITAGSTWNFQFWYRDPLGVLTSHNLSDAVSVTFCP
ncbi:MAG: right-handed parallel beta-helix repeat-containing protein [bacterium]|nr:hypothetical protein [Planctomycetota bacterium]HIL50754.1 hypothetical protein [Planctomycetota bacterium]